MARRSAGGDEATVLTTVMQKHLAVLKQRSIPAYFDWCQQHGFAPTLAKSREQRETELGLIEAHQAKLARQAKLHRNPRKLIEAVCHGEIRAADIQRPVLQQFCQSIERSKSAPDARAALQRLLQWVAAETDFLFEQFTYGSATYPAIDALIKLNDRRGQWVRTLEDWQRPSHNARRQFASFVRHLVARFPVPEFMDAAWLRQGPGSRAMREWYLHIASGKNIRTAKTPIPLTKMMAHHFVAAPATSSIESAFRWAEIHALGGDATLTKAILGSRLGTSFDHHDFWSAVIRFFIANPLLDREHVGPIVDYLHAQKFQTQDIVDQHGRATVEPPPQPHLQMRGRTAESLLAQVERWHQSLGRSRGAETLHFKSSGFKEASFKTGSKDAPSIWRFRELHSSHDLIAEGRAMRHCVASYARSCAAGHRSIWTLEVTKPTGVEKVQTIELTRQGVIVQCRGRLNRLPTTTEFELVRRWADHAGLTISPYVSAAD